MPAIINSDDGVVSGSAGLKTSGANDGILALQNNGTTNVTVTAAGNVGIGTSSPGQKLEVSNSSTNTTFSTVGNQLLIRNSGSTANAFSRIDFAGGASNNPTASIAATISNYGTGATDLLFGTFNTGGGVIAERARITTAGDFQFNSGYGSVATAYGCRAWVNFNGTGTVAIRASGNVTSITDNGTGDYTVNFTTAMPDANYSVVSTTSSDAAAITIAYVSGTSSVITTSSVRLVMATTGGAAADRTYVGVAIFR